MVCCHQTRFPDGSEDLVKEVPNTRAMSRNQIRQAYKS